MGEPCNGQRSFERLNHLRYIDGGWLQQLFPQRSPKLLELGIHGVPVLREQDLTGQRQAVTVDPAASDSNNDITGSHGPANDALVERNMADAHPDQIASPPFPLRREHLPDLGDLSAADGDPC